MERVFAIWLTAERGRFVLFLPVFMGAGVILYFALASEPPLWPAATMATISAAFAIRARQRAMTRAVSLCVLFAAAGFASATLATRRAPPWNSLPRTGVSVSGTVALVESLPVGRRITISRPSLDGTGPLAREVRIRLRNTDATVLQARDRIVMRALLRAPSPPDYPGGWDTQREAFFAGIAGYGFAIGPVRLLERAKGSGWQALRGIVAARVMQALPGERGAIAATLLTGLGTAIPADDRAAFQNSGLAHLLAVAGLHIGIVMGLVFAATRLALAAWERAALHWPAKQIASLAALAAGAGYLALTGGHLPILRSFAMACLVTLAVLTGRQAVSLRSLAFAAILLMVVSPQEVVGVSFQMSFAAVLALIAGYEALRPLIARAGPGAWWRRPALHLGGLAMTSLLAGTASLPFAVYHFGRATLWYVPANLLAVPLTAFWVLPLGLASLPLMPFGLEWLALVPMGWGIAAIVAIARAVSAWPDASLPVSQMPAWGLCLVAVGIAWIGLWRTRLRLAGSLPLLAGLVSPLLVTAPDIIVGPDAGVIALRQNGRVFVERANRASAFEQEAPERVWGASGEAFPCSAGDCAMPIGGAKALLVREHDSPSCGNATILLSSAPLHEACPGIPRIDRFSVWRNGAEAAWLGGETRIVTDRQTRGDRPWVIGRRLPVAKAE